MIKCRNIWINKICCHRTNQIECGRRSQDMENQPLIDEAVIIIFRRRRTNISMAWIDFWKTYAMVPQSWTRESLILVGRAENVIDLLKNSIEDKRTNLFSENTALRYININRNIFQGDLFLIGIYCDADPIDNCIAKSEARLFIRKGKTYGQPFWLHCDTKKTCDK